MKKLFTLTGPSCSGKSTLSRKLEETGEFHKVISTTTRAPRFEEKHGKDYYFISKNEFENKIDEGEFLEFNRFKDNYYGIDLEEIQRILKLGKTPLLVIEPEGLKTLRKMTTEFSFYSIYIDGLLEDLYSRFLARFKEQVEAKNADPIYEAKRLASINKEHQTWWLENTYNYSIPSFTSENEAATIKVLVQQALTFRTNKEHD